MIAVFTSMGAIHVECRGYGWHGTRVDYEINVSWDQNVRCDNIQVTDVCSVYRRSCSRLRQ